MRFTPKSEEELQMAQLLEPGEYEAEVAKATNETSKKGQDMIHLELKVWSKDGRTSYVHDYLSAEWFEFKLRHFCFAAGLGKLYQDGDVCAADCHGKQVRVELSMEPAKNGYGPKNVVKDYPKEQYEGSGDDSGKDDGDDLPF